MIICIFFSLWCAEWVRQAEKGLRLSEPASLPWVWIPCCWLRLPRGWRRRTSKANPMRGRVAGIELRSARALPGWLSRVWRIVGRVSARRPTDFLASPRKSAKKATRPPRSFAERMTALRCSQQAAGAELALRAQTAAPDFPACCCAARRGRNGLFGCPEPLRNLSRALAVDHLHFLSPLACRLEGSAGGKRAAHV